jgi:hypothetical protein
METMLAFHFKLQRSNSPGLLEDCTARHEAMALWFRDANSMAFLLAYKVRSFQKKTTKICLLGVRCVAQSQLECSVPVVRSNYTG